MSVKKLFQTGLCHTIGSLNLKNVKFDNVSRYLEVCNINISYIFRKINAFAFAFLSSILRNK